MKYISVASILSYTLFFGIGPGSIPLMITAELFTQGSRPVAMSVSVLVNWFTNFVVGLTFPLMKVSVGHKYTYPSKQLSDPLLTSNFNLSAYCKVTSSFPLQYFWQYSGYSPIRRSVLISVRDSKSNNCLVLVLNPISTFCCPHF